MCVSRASLIVFFEDPFWVGVYERRDGNLLEVCKITFGAEPKDYEIYQFLLTHFQDLRFSPALPDDRKKHRATNPKRMQRIVQKQMRPTGVGTKAQQALQLQHETSKAERKLASRAKRQHDEDQRFAHKQRKKKQKHRGH